MIKWQQWNLSKVNCLYLSLFSAGWFSTLSLPGCSFSPLSTAFRFPITENQYKCHAPIWDISSSLEFLNSAINQVFNKILTEGEGREIETNLLISSEISQLAFLSLGQSLALLIPLWLAAGRPGNVLTLDFNLQLVSLGLQCTWFCVDREAHHMSQHWWDQDVNLTSSTLTRIQSAVGIS